MALLRVVPGRLSMATVLAAVSLGSVGCSLTLEASRRNERDVVGVDRSVSNDLGAGETSVEDGSVVTDSTFIDGPVLPDEGVINPVDVPRMDVQRDVFNEDVRPDGAVNVDVPADGPMRIDVPTLCPTGQTLCGAGCVDTSSNAAHCGGCNVGCAFPHARAECVGGMCRPGACDMGFRDCDGNPGNGCETDITLPGTCGACDNRCPERMGTMPTCSMGACGSVCVAGRGDCDRMADNGCEAELSTITNCGACGRACAGVLSCFDTSGTGLFSCCRAMPGARCATNPCGTSERCVNVVAGLGALCCPL